MVCQLEKNSLKTPVFKTLDTDLTQSVLDLLGPRELLIFEEVSRAANTHSQIQYFSRATVIKDHILVIQPNLFKSKDPKALDSMGVTVKKIAEKLPRLFPPFKDQLLREKKSMDQLKKLTDDDIENIERITRSRIITSFEDEGIVVKDQAVLTMHRLWQNDSPQAMRGFCNIAVALIFKFGYSRNSDLGNLVAISYGMVRGAGPLHHFLKKGDQAFVNIVRDLIVIGKFKEAKGVFDNINFHNRKYTMSIFYLTIQNFLAAGKINEAKVFNFLIIDTFNMKRHRSEDLALAFEWLGQIFEKALKLEKMDLESQNIHEEMLKLLEHPWTKMIAAELAEKTNKKRAEKEKNNIKQNGGSKGH